MEKLDQFHDGFINGLLVERAATHIFLTTNQGQQFVLVVEGLLRLKLEDFREGNIILSAWVRPGDDLTATDIVELYGYEDEGSALKKLETARVENLVVLEISPSYGASLIALAKTVNLISRQDWVNQLGAASAQLHPES